MVRRILDYLPVVLRDVPEFMELMAAEQPEIEALWDAQDGALSNQFVLTAEDYGLRRWERMLNISPKGTPEARRIRILSLLGLKLPYTVRWLKNWLEGLVGAGNYDVSIVGYLISLTLRYSMGDDRYTDDIMATLHIVKPANMLLGVTEIVAAPPIRVPLTVTGATFPGVMRTTLPAYIPTHTQTSHVRVGAVQSAATRTMLLEYEGGG